MQSKFYAMLYKMKISTKNSTAAQGHKNQMKTQSSTVPEHGTTILSIWSNYTTDDTIG